MLLSILTVIIMLTLLSLFNTHQKVINITKPCMKMEIMRDGDLINVKDASIDLFISTQIHEYAGKVEVNFVQNNKNEQIKLSFGDSVKIEDPKDLEVTYSGRGGAKVYIWALPNGYCQNYNILSINQKNGKIHFSSSLNHTDICWFTSFNSNVAYESSFNSNCDSTFYNIIDISSIEHHEILNSKLNSNANGFLDKMQLVRLKGIKCPIDFLVNYSTNMSYGDWTDSPRYFQIYSQNHLKNNTISDLYIITERSVAVWIWVVSFAFVACCFTTSFIILFIFPKYSQNSKGSKKD